MTKILIADQSKPSIVMTSEVIKDKIAGAMVLISGTGRSCLEMVAEAKPDMCIVDFDLPDVDGPDLMAALRRIYSGPIIMTAFPKDMALVDADTDMPFFNDALCWVAKPVRFEELAERLERFIVERHRLGKRFDTTLPSKIVGKASGRGKRAPKVKGRIVNLSLGGACMYLDGQLKMKKSQELTLAITFPHEQQPERSGARAEDMSSQRPKVMGSPPLGNTIEAKFKARVAWISSDGQIGLEFGKLTDVQKKGLEAYLRGSTSAGSY